MRAHALAATLLLITTATLANAQSDIGGRHTYPQFRIFSGLPGGGYGVMPDGTPSTDGALALATPIGYALGGHLAVNFFNTSNDLDPFRFDAKGGHEETGNGSAAFTVGSSFLRGYHASIGLFVLSGHLDTAIDAEVSSPRFGRVTVAAGVQDLDGGGGSAGTGNQYDGESSQSFFGVGTYDFGHNVYASAGVGTHRFGKGFANVSAPVTTRLRATAEYDGFNFNGGLLYGTGRLKGVRGRLSRAEASLFLGIVKQHDATLGVNFTL